MVRLRPMSCRKCVGYRGVFPLHSEKDKAFGVCKHQGAISFIPKPLGGCVFPATIKNSSWFWMHVSPARPATTAGAKEHQVIGDMNGRDMQETMAFL